MRSFLLLVITLFISGAALSGGVVNAEEGPSPYARNASSEELKRALDWYALNALGALRPKITFPLTPRQFQDAQGNALSAERAIRALADLGVWKQDGEKSPGIVIQLPYRAYLWWPGVPDAADEFLLAPLAYEIVSVDRVVEELRGSVPALRVEFTWRIKSEVPLLSKLQGIGWIPSLTQSLEESRQQFKSLIGTTEQNSVVMDKGEYGYFLQISREPIF